MPILKTKVNPFQERGSESSASKFIKFLNVICFIAVKEKNGKLTFEFFSLKTLLHIIFVGLCLYGFTIVNMVAFEYETDLNQKFETVAEHLSMGLLMNLIIMPLLQPMILRYAKVNFTQHISIHPHM